MEQLEQTFRQSESQFETARKEFEYASEADQIYRKFDELFVIATKFLRALTKAFGEHVSDGTYYYQELLNAFKKPGRLSSWISDVNSWHSIRMLRNQIKHDKDKSDAKLPSKEELERHVRFLDDEMRRFRRKVSAEGQRSPSPHRRTASNGRRHSHDDSHHHSDTHSGEHHRSNRGSDSHSSSSTSSSRTGRSRPSSSSSSSATSSSSSSASHRGSDHRHNTSHHTSAKPRSRSRSPARSPRSSPPRERRRSSRSRSRSRSSSRTRTRSRSRSPRTRTGGHHRRSSRSPPPSTAAAMPLVPIPHAGEYAAPAYAYYAWAPPPPHLLGQRCDCAECRWRAAYAASGSAATAPPPPPPWPAYPYAAPAGIMPTLAQPAPYSVAATAHPSRDESPRGERERHKDMRISSSRRNVELYHPYSRSQSPAGATRSSGNGSGGDARAESKEGRRG